MFWEMVNLFCVNYKIILTAGIIMASMIIVLIGALKPLLFNKIKNKCFRGFLLSLSNVVASFVAVAVLFKMNNINYDYYWFTGSCFCVFCVFIYWCYENLTQARAIIHKIGSAVWRKLAPIIRNKLDGAIGKLNDTKKITNIVDDFVSKNGDKTKSNKNDTKGL